MEQLTGFRVSTEDESSDDSINCAFLAGTVF